jgi:hypothetical protein
MESQALQMLWTQSNERLPVYGRSQEETGQTRTPVFPVLILANTDGSVSIDCLGQVWVAIGALKFDLSVSHIRLKLDKPTYLFCQV